VTVLYGTSVADTTLATANVMATASGGVETSKLSNLTGTNIWAECYSQGGTIATVTTQPSQSGHGWVYYPGAGTYALGNWSASAKVSLVNNGNSQFTIRFSKKSGSTYTTIGSIASAANLPTGVQTLSFAATSMAATTFAASDALYIDLLYFDNANYAGTDNPTIYEGNSATAGVASDMQVTTSTFTAAGNAIVGRARAKFLEAIAQNGPSRAKFIESIGSFGRSRSKFTISIGSKQASRSKFLVSIGQKGVSRSNFVISKATKGLARSKFVESIAQKGRARSKFLLSAAIKGLAESTFKIAVAGGHAITAYIRSRYKVSIRQTQAQRSKFLIRFSQAGMVRSLYKVAAKTSAQARSRFLVRFGITGRVRSRYLLSIRQTAVARSRFITRLALVVRARAKFLVQSVLIVRPVKSIVHVVSQYLTLAWKQLSALNLFQSSAQSLSISSHEVSMPAPNTTILSTITVTDVTGALVSNLGAVNLTVTFPDSTTSTLALGTGVTNLGLGQYQAKYNTKGVGAIKENWSLVGADGTTLATFQDYIEVQND
jgi:hypothetical protein